MEGKKNKDRKKDENKRNGNAVVKRKQKRTRK